MRIVKSLLVLLLLNSTSCSTKKDDNFPDDSVRDFGITGVLTVTSEINAGDIIKISLLEGNLNIKNNLAEMVKVAVTSNATSEKEDVVLVENNVNTGVFEGILRTKREALKGENYDGILNVDSSHIISVTYVDEFDDNGKSVIINSAISVLSSDIPTTYFSEYDPDRRQPRIHEGYNLVWNEEFDVDAPSVNPNDWNFEQGFKRNEELQWYQDNTTIKNHCLIIEARKETVQNPNYDSSSSDWKKKRATASYTSTSITTRGKHSWKYGRLEVRAKIPTENGAWPAIWTLGSMGEWPSNGEIDILELYLKNGKPTILANFAWGTKTRWQAAWDGYNKPLSEFAAEDSDWIKKFHIWRMDWDANTIKIYLDDVLLNSHSTQQENATTSYGGVLKPFDQAHYLLLNLAIGSNGGDPGGTEFPLQYVIDYVRIYQISD